MDWKPIRIVIVDDHPVVRHGLRSLLSGHPDMEIIGAAENGAQVLPLLAAHPADVLLMDIQMQGQDGISVSRRIRKIHPQIKIIILTTYDDESYLQQALAAGADAYLLKSVSHETLPDSIRAVMRGEKLLSPSLITQVMTDYQRLAVEHARREAGLTQQDLEMLQDIAGGASTKEIAEKKFLSEATVKRRVQEILEKLGAGNRAQAIAAAIRQGWI